MRESAMFRVGRRRRRGRARDSRAVVGRFCITVISLSTPRAFHRAQEPQIAA
ncbi:hypothetical protein ACP70R_034993 [Stipagrostis hirtigluma subsp. patula]